MGWERCIGGIGVGWGGGGGGGFFFQAEDGIRDRLVTGVQTCALPISFLQRKRGFRRPCSPYRA